jgi:integrase
MVNEAVPSTTTITVITRHSADCPQTNPQWKRCKCRKSLYIYENGKVRYASAKTRSWEQAERVAQAERDKRDPVKLELQKIAEQKAAEAERVAALEASEVTIEDALDRWVRSKKELSYGSAAAYRVVSRKIRDWAEGKGIRLLQDVTPKVLDEWRGQWSPNAKRRDDRIGITTQSHLLTRVKSFFSWATKIRLINYDPAWPLATITPSGKRTIPLTPGQFEELLAATAMYDADQTRDQDKWGKELRVLFLVMRWSGLRIADVLLLPRSALVGNRLSLTTLKTKAAPTLVIPDHVVKALLELQPRPNTDPGYFWWTGKSHHLTLTTQWTHRINDFNRYLKFHDEFGKPMRFHSHQLRDTFAVELLLAGMPIEKVSRLLTHKSVRVTEKYYAPWNKPRLEQLEAESIEAMRRMGVTVSQ